MLHIVQAQDIVPSAESIYLQILLDVLAVVKDCVLNPGKEGQTNPYSSAYCTVDLNGLKTPLVIKS